MKLHLERLPRPPHPAFPLFPLFVAPARVDVEWKRGRAMFRFGAPLFRDPRRRRVEQGRSFARVLIKSESPDGNNWIEREKERGSKGAEREGKGR